VNDEYIAPGRASHIALISALQSTNGLFLSSLQRGSRRSKKRDGTALKKRAAIR
jgi:hypothetical protein